MSMRKTLIGVAALVAVVAGSLAVAQPGGKEPKGAPAGAAPGGPPEMQLPPGWTTEDMQQCMLAGTPGKMHELLQKDVGVWTGTNEMWMAPGMESIKSPTTWTITSVMDGRYIRTEVAGDMPGMGPFTGSGVSGYDNVSQKFVGDWIDNHSTGIMQGTGDLSSDGKTVTWKYTYNCPITKKPAIMRQVVRHTGEKTMSVEMSGADPKTGKEFKMMQMELTRK